MPKRPSQKVKLLAHHTLDESSSSSSSSDSDDQREIPFMPATKPSFGPIGSCDLISKVRMFLPIIAKAELPTQSCDPDLIEPSIRVTEELEPEHGVEMDISLGVFDVAGKVDDHKMDQLGIPIVNAPDSPPIIQEM